METRPRRKEEKVAAARRRGGLIGGAAAAAEDLSDCATLDAAGARRADPSAAPKSKPIRSSLMAFSLCRAAAAHLLRVASAE